MSQTFRHPEILEIARREGKVTVEDLASRFGVTLQTIRRDLADLSDLRKLERVHGGAVLPSGTTNIDYQERRSLNEEAKARIARICAREIPDGAALFLGIGTTTEAVARELLHHRSLLVITNNMNVANILMGNAECQIIVAGGALRQRDGGLVGALTVDAIRQFKFDIAVIGCSAVDADGDLLDFDVQEVGVSRAILEQARRTFLVADRSKFSRNAPARIAPLSELDRVFTDAPLPPDLEAFCRDGGTQVDIG
ncbi:DeoR/GlpR family DNA-binding transcription regulator [Jannaschia aquimarina]|uniref:GlpR protein n=1 Tax=Jannaschia aquimarina TaxID=935700 RepID=A0A0D1D8X2_9RHOB|nr:DeoR/GlpR family DNA-binding transcription regulator [Jannaschia aquimarina]KIT16328.1 Glycerol-3-phosphate regulon repressor [Jannaschia aquimarina]SNT26110.1 transcriptional regulator, DeoR family [Jannaschia aquimarina]